MKEFEKNFYIIKEAGTLLDIEDQIKAAISKYDENDVYTSALYPVYYSDSLCHMRIVEINKSTNPEKLVLTIAYYKSVHRSYQTDTVYVKTVDQSIEGMVIAKYIDAKIRELENSGSKIISRYIRGELNSLLTDYLTSYSHRSLEYSITLLRELRDEIEKLFGAVSENLV